MLNFRISAVFFAILLHICTCVYSVPSLQHNKHNYLIPAFGGNYIVQGVILLPYAEIKEPFTAYYDGANNRSRIDYYGEMVKTYQRGDLGGYGISYKVAYMADTKGQPIRTCFEVDGSVNSTVGPQSIIPDLSSFQYYQSLPCVSLMGVTDETCDVWISKNTVGYKVNEYTMYLKKDGQLPVFYEMKGYDTLLGSHYDKYQLYYTSFSAGGVTSNDFVVDKGLKCGGFPGPGVEEMVSNNPLQEFVNNEDGHIQSAFTKFITKHGKSYGNTKEHVRRGNIFRQNYRYISSMNRAGLSYALATNHLTDFSDTEIRRLRGRLPSKGYNGGKPFPSHEFSNTLPDFVDWELFGAVTPVEDQAICGSCWSFGTTGTIEGAYFRKTSKLVRLSQQQLIDCSWPYLNNGCDGGEDFRAYQYIMAAKGLASEEDYGSYLGEDGMCHDRNVTKTAVITGYVNVTSGDIKALKQAVAYKGPISVSIDASQKSFSFYSHGVYYDPNCKNGPDQLDHSVLAVGYGSVNGSDYWIVKNSWSTYWGNNGYVLMSQKGNNCGVATSPTYVLM